MKTFTDSGCKKVKDDKKQRITFLKENYVEILNYYDCDGMMGDLVLALTSKFCDDFILLLGVYGLSIVIIYYFVFLLLFS